MPTINSNEYSTFSDAKAPHVDVTEWGGRVRSRYAQHEAGTIAQNDFLRLFPIHKGEKPLMFLIRNEAFGASVTLDVGLEGGDEDKFVAAADINGTTDKVLMSLSLEVETANGTVVAKFEGADPSDTADLEVIMLYVVD